MSKLSIYEFHLKKSILGYIVAIFACMGIFAGGAVLAAGKISVSPISGLTNGQTISVSATGVASNSTGSILECNNDPTQPNVTVAGNAVPVSCSNPLSSLVTTTANGNLAPTSFTVKTGTVGPAASGTDSSGGNAATDAANYPCPPTPAQLAAGYTCIITFGDASNDNLSQIISFASQEGSSTPAAPAAPTPAAPTPKATATTTPTTKALTNTGPGDTIGIFAAIVILASVAHYLFTNQKRNRSF